MNIILMCLSKVWDIDEKGIYSDLLREFTKQGHNVFVVTPVERRYGEDTHLVNQGKAQILMVKTLNVQKTNVIEKGLGTFLIEYQYYFAVRKFFKNIHFDLVLCSTPPITLVKPIRYIKKRDKAKTYLMLKDIFPQNAVDLGMLSKHGIKGILYKYFRHEEKNLYKVSDFIGCMSPANVSYILEHNKEIPPEKVHVSPNSVEPMVRVLSLDEKRRIREKYNIPSDKKIFIYGGNLGKPQGVSFIVECIREARKIPEAFFVVCGTGTDYNILADFVNSEHPDNILLLNGLPKEEYEELAAAGDVGLIFLDYRFTIPNFPSRLLSYMQNGLPVLAITDTNSDVGNIVVESGFGWMTESNNASDVERVIEKIVSVESFEKMRENEIKYLEENYSVEKQSNIIYSYCYKEN